MIKYIILITMFIGGIYALITPKKVNRDTTRPENITIEASSSAIKKKIKAKRNVASISINTNELDKYKKISEAYQIIKDNEKKKIQDKSNEEQAQNSDLNEVEKMTPFDRKLSEILEKFAAQEKLEDLNNLDEDKIKKLNVIAFKYNMRFSLDENNAIIIRPGVALYYSRLEPDLNEFELDEYLYQKRSENEMMNEYLTSQLDYILNKQPQY